MIKNKLRNLRRSIEARSSLDLWIIVSSIFILLVLVYGIISLSPFPAEVENCIYVAAVLILIGCYFCFRARHHQDESKSDDSDKSAPSDKEDEKTAKEDKTLAAEHKIPPMPESPPTIAIDNQSLAPPTDTNVSVETSTQRPPRRGLRRPSIFRELVTENDVHWLVIHTYTPVPQQGLFKKKLWRHKIQKLELDDSPDVNIRLATKIPIRPTDGETKIYHLQRLHWLSHGIPQLGIAFGTLLLAWLTSAASIQNGGANFPTSLLLTIVIVGGICYYFVWIHWAYRYLVFTNLKIRLSYVPPLNLPRSTPSTDLAALQGGTDPSSGIIGNIFGFGTIRTETVANVVDNWLLKSVRFVKNYERVALLLDQLRENLVKTHQHR